MASSNKERGDRYENYICNKLNKNTIAFLWDKIPEKHLLLSGLIHDLNKHRLEKIKAKKNNKLNPLQDVGIDILHLKSNGEYVFVQCKNGYDEGLTVKNIAGFSWMMLNHEDKKGKLYYTSKLSRHIKENSLNKRIQFKKQIMWRNDEIVFDENISLYDYQQEAVKTLQEYFINNKRGILSFPCGVGKTIISCYFSKIFKNIVILSPLRQYAEQNLFKFLSYDPSFKGLLVDSDGTRDIDEIREFMNNDNQHVFSSTFASVDIMNQVIRELNNCIIIIDEFHDLSKNQILDETNEMNKLLNSDSKILFMSATPRVYEMEDEDFSYEDIFGPVVCKMDVKTAITNNYICDYKIYFPAVLENTEQLQRDIQQEININSIDNDILVRCIYFIKCHTFNGSNKCIIYCRDTNEIELFKECLVLLKEYYSIDLSIYSITTKDFHSKTLEENSREWKLKMFSEDNYPSVMLSIKILDECVDIPACDSVYISYPSENKIRTLQRMFRCLRKTENKKLGHVYIWCNEYNNILNTLSGIKEYDSDFREKIQIQVRTEARRKRQGEYKYISHGDTEGKAGECKIR